MNLPIPIQGRPPSILLVDDQAENLEVLQELLDAKGYHVRPVPDGPLAIQAAELAPPDLVLLDIFMPGMDGFEVCRRMRAIAGLEDVPVLFISAYGSVYDRVAAFRCGGVDYISKPFQAEEVEARVATHLTLVRLRRDLEEASRKLAVSVGEAELFAQVAARDLRIPLQQAAAYAGRLPGVLGTPGPQGAEASLCLDGIRQGLDSMDRLLDDLLGYSQAGRAPLRRQPVDLDGLVREARLRLDPEARSRGLRWEVAPLPAVEGDPELLGVVVQNLLANAVKFTRTVREAVVQVLPLEDGPGFLVRDNGIGFPESRAEEIFKPFRRLNRQERYEGTGLGLAQVQRIVARHGGRVWAEGAPAAGATFRVRLPNHS